MRYLTIKLRRRVRDSSCTKRYIDVRPAKGIVGDVLKKDPVVTKDLRARIIIEYRTARKASLAYNIPS